MTKFANKSFNVQMRSGQSPDDLDERWRRTFGDKMPEAPKPPPPVAEHSDVPPIKSVALADIFALLDREAEKCRLNGDLITAELFELVRAKMRVFEK